jgi:drug/metabolite transporter (DMT)-like permease
MRTFLLLGGVLAICLQAVIAVYAIALNDSGHTGAEPFLTFLYFGPLFCLSLFAWWKKRVLKRTAQFSAAAAIAGILLVVLLDVTNMLVQYQRWAKRGLPERGTVSWLK